MRCNVRKQLSASGGHLSWRCLCCRRRPGCDGTYCREWGGHRESMSICVCLILWKQPSGLHPPVYLFLSSHLSLILKPLALFHALSIISAALFAFNFLWLSPPPPALQPWLRLHLWLTTNSLTCRLQHSCPNPPPTSASEKQTHPAGDYILMLILQIIYYRKYI